MHGSIKIVDRPGDFLDRCGTHSLFNERLGNGSLRCLGKGFSKRPGAHAFTVQWCAKANAPGASAEAEFALAQEQAVAAEAPALGDEHLGYRECFDLRTNTGSRPRTQTSFRSCEIIATLCNSFHLATVRR
jgi:hypothetical protein